jgi:hypothetical protein
VKSYYKLRERGVYPYPGRVSRDTQQGWVALCPRIARQPTNNQQDNNSEMTSKTTLREKGRALFFAALMATTSEPVTTSSPFT